MTGCCCSWDALITWERPLVSLSVFLLGNAILLSLWMEFPIVAYMLSYGGFFVLACGLLAKLTKTVDPDTFSADIWKKDKIEKCAGDFHATMMKSVGFVVPIIFWKDVTTSAIALGVLYAFSTVISFVSISFVCFAVFNAVFVYGKFQSQIDTLIGPYIGEGKDLLCKGWSMVPRYKKKL